jgi:hypothetical protein
VAAGGAQYVFWRDADNNLLKAWWEGTGWDGTRWTPPQFLPGMGPLGSKPTAGVDSHGNQYVFWKGTDNNLWGAFWDGTRWNGPTSISIMAQLGVETQEATNITANRATLHGTVLNNGGPAVTWNFLFGTSQANAQIVAAGTLPEIIGAQALGFVVNGLNPSTTYTFEARASNQGQGVSSGTFLSFTTPSATPPPPPPSGSTLFSLDYNPNRDTRIGNSNGPLSGNPKITKVINKSFYNVELAIDVNGTLVKTATVNAGQSTTAFNGYSPTESWVGVVVGNNNPATGVGPFEVDW